TVQITLANPSNATLGAKNTTFTYTIKDDDPNVAFAAATSTVSEGAGNAVVPVVLSAQPGKTVTVHYAVSGGTANGKGVAFTLPPNTLNAASGTATSQGVDYTLAAGTLTFGPTDTTKNITIPIIDDALNEADETIQITLSAASGVSLGQILTHTV